MSAAQKAPDGGDRCRRCGLGAEPATWYCGACWAVVAKLRDVAGGAFDRDGEWEPRAAAPAPEGRADA